MKIGIITFSDRNNMPYLKYYEDLYKYFDKNVNPSNFNRNLSNDETNTINLDERKFTMFLSNGDILNYHIDKWFSNVIVKNELIEDSNKFLSKNHF